MESNNLSKYWWKLVNHELRSDIPVFSDMGGARNSRIGRINFTMNEIGMGILFSGGFGAVAVAVDNGDVSQHGGVPNS